MCSDKELQNIDGILRALTFVACAGSIMMLLVFLPLSKSSGDTSIVVWIVLGYLGLCLLAYLLIVVVDWIHFCLHDDSSEIRTWIQKHRSILWMVLTGLITIATMFPLSFLDGRVQVVVPVGLACLLLIIVPPLVDKCRQDNGKKRQEGYKPIFDSINTKRKSAV